MSDEKSLPLDTLKALAAEIRADEHAARVRDFGEELAEPVIVADQSMEPERAQSIRIDPEMDRVFTDLEKSWQAAPEQPSHEDNARLELTDEEHGRHLDDVAASYGLSREQMEDHYERWGNGEDPEAHSETYDDFLNEATERAASRMQGKGRDR